MATLTPLSVEKRARPIGTPGCPPIVDVRTDKAFLANQRLVPGSLARVPDRVAEWAPRLRGSSVVVVCEDGRRNSHGVAAWLRGAGIDAEALQGGLADWAAAERPMVPADRIRNRDAQGRAVWVTRARPEVDRIACPWLIRRLVDPDAVFLFVPPSEVVGVAERFEAAPFDIDDPGTVWRHRGDLCTFDVMVEELGLAAPPFLHVATLVRGADPGRPDRAPEAAGRPAASLGLSRIDADDLAQREAGMRLYDAFDRWCRDATEETHNGPTNKPEERA